MKEQNMKFEFSAGGIVYKFDKNQTWILLCQHSYHHGWGFPKGLIGDNPSVSHSTLRDEPPGSDSKSSGQVKETKAEAAVREVEEETGAKAEIIRALNPITYWYQFENEKIKKTVYYYIMKYTGGDITKHDTEMENVEWVESKNVLSKLTFKADKKVFQEALPIIEKIVNVSS